MIQSKNFTEKFYVDSRKADILFKKHLSGKINISQEIWKWIHLNEWLKTVN
jgi:asparagine synthase (glutamine-hydrolysing)